MKILFSCFFCLFFSGCSVASKNQEKYNDLLNYMMPGYGNQNVDIGNLYSYRFLEKYKISHQWLSGFNIPSCRYHVNVYRWLGGYGDLMKDKVGPYYENNGVLSATNLYGESDILPENLSNYTVGRMESGRREYKPFCSYAFDKPQVGMALYIIRPDDNEAASEFVDQAVPVNVSGLHWLKKEVSPSAERYRYYPNAAPVEFWVLKIPDSSYWMVLKLSRNPKITVQQHNEEYLQLRNLFYGIIASVKLEPITPIDYKKVASPM